MEARPFSRDRYDALTTSTILEKEWRKWLFHAKEHISEGPEGIILEAMLEADAEFYSAELSEKIHRGQKENALKGKNNGGGVPLGYLLDKKAQKLAIDPTTAPLVVEVFEKYADGKSVRSIVEDFNARGLKTKRGQPFNINSFSSLLKNRKYIGEYRYQDVVIEGGRSCYRSGRTVQPCAGTHGEEPPCSRNGKSKRGLSADNKAVLR